MEMLTVDQHDLIRRKHLVDGMSQRAIAQELGHARNTVAKAIAHPIPPGYRLTKPRPQPTIDPVKHIIDAWLEQDKLGRRKQTHTGRRIFERLRDEHNFKGSVTTVRRYIQEIKQYPQEVYMPLAFEPGEEAQVDWHEGWIEENGVQRKAHFFCMRLCYSKPSSLVIIQTRPLLSEQLAQDSVLLLEILDNSGLLLVHPSRDRDEQDIPWVQMHGADCILRHPAREEEL